MPEIKYTYKNLSRKKIIDIIFIVTKITIIGFISIWLIGNFVPFYDGADSKVYGVSAIDLANGEFGFSNELLQQTGEWYFIPGQYVKTVYDTAIPVGSFGIYGISSIVYFVAGLNGLFYLGPIIAIIFLISSERIATNLFGRGAGLATLLLISTDFAILNGSLQLLTNITFALFLVLGCFFLIKFLHKKKNLYIFLCSSLFSIAAFFRITGIIFFPIEISIIIGYVIITNLIYKQNNFTEKKILKNFKQILFTKNFFITSTMVLIPWIIFSIFLLSYNAYFFGDPLTTYSDVRPTVEKLQEGSWLSFFTFDQDRFEWINFYLTGFIPDEILQKVQHISSDNHLWNLKLNWMGGISIVILATGLAIAMKEKTKRVPIIILILFALSLPLFHSTAYLHNYDKYFDADPSFKTAERYMMPSFLMLSLIFGFIMQKIWDIYLRNNSTSRQKKALAFKSIFVVIFVTFFLFSIYDSLPVENLKTSSFKIKNPNDFTNWIPDDMENLPPDSIIFGTKLRRAIEADVIFFNLNYGIGGWVNRTLVNTPQEPIQTLKQVMDSGYDVFTFKDNKRVEQEYFKYLITEHGFVIKDHSKTFCKLELIDENEIKINNFTNVKSDQICLIKKIIIYK